MSDDFFNDFDDVMDESEGSILASALWMILRVVVFTLSAVTTFAFFANYVGGAFEFVAGSELSPYVSGMAGVFVLDFAALAWSNIRAKHAKTNTQMSVSRFTGLGDLIASVVVTALFLSLHAGFSIGIYAADGVTLTSLGQSLHYIGMFIIIVAVSGNFVAGYLYANGSAETLLAVQKAKIAAGRRAAAFAAERARIALTTQHTMDEIKRQLPDLAKQDGVQSGQEYLGRTTRSGAKGGGEAEMLAEPKAFDEGIALEVGPMSDNGQFANIDIIDEHEDEEPQTVLPGADHNQRPRRG